MKIEVVLTESEIAQEFLESLEARDLPEKFFYWLPSSVRAWASLAHESGYFVDLNRTWKAAVSRMPALLEHFGKTAAVVSYGCGDGIKDRFLIHALTDAGMSVSYFPVDGSQALLETACAAAEDDDIETLGIKADISSPVHLIFAADASDGPRLFLMCGSTLGAFDPLEEIRCLAQCLSKNDRLAIDAELLRDDSLARRGNPAVLSFGMASLAGIGVGEPDGELRFEQKRDDRHEGLFMMSRHFRAARDISTTGPGEVIHVQKGERIAMNFQYVFTPAAFRWLIQEHAGLTIVEEFPSPEGRYMTVICRR